MIQYKNTLKKLLAIFLSTLILFSQTLNAAVKSSSGNAATNPESSNLVSGGSAGLFTEDKVSLIGEDTLQTQNYNDIDVNLDFSKYKQITLKRVILEGLSSSNTLKAAKEKLLIQARIVYEEANNDYLPKLDFQLDSTMTKRYTTLEESSGLRDVKDFRENKYKLTLDQPIYSGGSTSLNIQSKTLKYQEAKNKYEIVVNQTIQKAIDAYFKLLFNMEKVELASNTMKKLNEILGISQVKYDSGAIGIGDLAAIKANVANSETNLNNIKSNLADSIDYYIYLLSDKFKNTKPFQKNFNTNLGTYDELKEEIISKNLGLINHRLNILSNKYKLKSFKAALKPKVDLQVKMTHIYDQEDFIDDEEFYSARFVLRYNLFNQGKDVNKIVKTHSSIEELNYRYNEEIKKISWDTSKLYNSIKSLGKSLKSTKDEIESSNEMVDVYWEGFQLGEQDLQILLTGHQQLSSAELNLLKFKQDYLINVFKVLSQTNKLASFFDIDPYNTSFVDYSTVTKMDTNIDLNTSILSKNLDLNTSINNYLDVITQYSFDNVINFKDDFLVSPDEKYTVVISEFNNTYDAYSYIKLNRLFTNSFAYDYIKENGTFKANTINKKVEVKTNIAHGIFNKKEDAQIAINNMFDNDNSKNNYKIQKLKNIKDLYSSYVGGLKTSIPAYIIKPLPKKVFRTNAAFKKKFMSANEDKFTINIVSLANIRQAAKLVRRNNIYNDSFVFKYGKNGEWVKVMYGVFDTYSQALEVLNSKSNLKNTYYPIIEKIKQKQDLFNKYQDYNKIIKPKIHYVKANKSEIKKENKKLFKQAIPEKKKIIQKKEKKKAIFDKKPIKKKVSNAIPLVIPTLPILPIVIPAILPVVNLEKTPKKVNKPVISKDKALNVKDDTPNIIEKDIKKLVSKEEKEIILFDPKPKKEILTNNPNKTIVNIDLINKKLFNNEIKNKIPSVNEQKNIPSNLKVKEEKEEIIFDTKPKKETFTINNPSKKIKIEKINELVKKKSAPKVEILSNRSVVKEKIKTEPKLELIKKHLINKKVFDKKPKKEILPLRKISKNKLSKDEKSKQKINKQTNKKQKIEKNIGAKSDFEAKPKKEITIQEIKKDKKPKKELKVKKQKKKKNTKNYARQFEKDFENAPDSNYAIVLATIPKEKLNYFIKRYIIDDKYIIKKENNTYKIIYGLFNTKADATNAINSLHPKIANTVKIVSLESLK